MKITREQFDIQCTEKTLKLAFVGMSNIGKSHWSEALEESMKFDRYGVDDHIADSLGLDGMEGMVRWMGYPFEDRYPQTQSEYLVKEEKLTRFDEWKSGSNVILDTTGSVVHLSDDVLEYLKKEYTIVLFDTSLSLLDDMIEEFFRTPKRIVRGDEYQPLEEELGIDTLRRCYPGLLEYRINKYRDVADVVMPGEFTRIKGLSVERFWEMLRLSFPKD